MKFSGVALSVSNRSQDWLKQNLTNQSVRFVLLHYDAETDSVESLVYCKEKAIELTYIMIIFYAISFSIFGKLKTRAKLHVDNNTDLHMHSCMHKAQQHRVTRCKWFSLDIL